MPSSTAAAEEEEEVAPRSNPVARGGRASTAEAAVVETAKADTATVRRSVLDKCFILLADGLDREGLGWKRFCDTKAVFWLMACSRRF